MNVENVDRRLHEGKNPALFWRKIAKQSHKKTKVRIAALHSDIFYCILLENMPAFVCERLWCAKFYHRNLQNHIFISVTNLQYVYLVTKRKPQIRCVGKWSI
jgi:hypothetical protein